MAPQLNHPSEQLESVLGLSPEGRLWRILMSEKKDIWVVIIYGICAGLFSLIVPVAIQSVVNTISFGSMLQPVFVLTFLVLVMLSFGAVMRTMQNFVMEIIQQRIFARIAMDLAYRIPRVRIDVYDDNQGAELVNRFFDVLIVQKSAAVIILDGIAILLQTLLGMVLLAFYHPYLLAFDCLLIISIGFVFFGLGKNAVKTSILESKAKYAVAAWLEELARNPFSFKSYGGSQYASYRCDELTATYLEARKTHFAILLRQIVGSTSIQVISSALLLALGGCLVIQRQLTLGQLVASELVVTSVVAGFAKFAKYLETYYDLVAAADKLGYLVDLPLESKAGETLSASHTAAASIQLKNVSFNYQNQKSSLQDIHLNIPSGSRVAILGNNGSGKSTLASVIFGLRRPTQGVVEIDGMDLRNVNLEELRADMSFIRGVEIFDATILENIRMKRPEITVEEVRATLESLDLLEGINALPEGMLTHLSGSQCPLSSGQMQRLMLARAIVGKPRLLILDESLDNIDDQAHDKVMSVLFDKKSPWTLLLTTHNLEVVSFCDHFYFLSGGKIQEGRAFLK